MLRLLTQPRINLAFRSACSGRLQKTSLIANTLRNCASTLISSASTVRHLTSTATPTTATSASAAPLVAPEFGTNTDTERRFVYIKGVKNDGRSKRFYASVEVEPVMTTRGEEYGIRLDGRFIVTPYNQILSAPNLMAANAIAFEWDSQGDFIRPISMPLTNICVTALDQAFHDRARFLTHFKNAMQTDSVFLRVTQPSGLVAQQQKQWDPLLTWMKERYGIEFKTTIEIATPNQSPEAITKQTELLSSLTGWQLAALDALTTVTKSFIISWSLLTDRISITQAFEAARLEENFQMRQYGQVEGVYGHGIEMEFTRVSLAAAKTWVNLVTPDPKANPFLQPNNQPTHHQ